MQARFVLQWLAGEIDALPLWNGGPQKLHVTDGAVYPQTRAGIDEVYSWALLAEFRYPWPAEPDRAEERLAFGWTRGVIDLFTWACGEAAEGPLSGQRTAGRPALYEVSLTCLCPVAGFTPGGLHGDHCRLVRVGAGAGVSWRWPGPAPAGLDVSGGHGRCRGCQQVAVDGLDLVGERVQVTGGHRQHRVELCRHLDPQRLHTQLEISRITGEPGCLAGRDDPQPAGLAAQQDLLVDTAILGSEDHRDRICAMPLGRDDLGGAGGG